MLYIRNEGNLRLAKFHEDSDSAETSLAIRNGRFQRSSYALRNGISHELKSMKSLGRDVDMWSVQDRLLYANDGHEHS